MKEESDLVKFAKQELAMLGGEDDGVQVVMNKHLLEIVKLFSDEGHSGPSASYAISVLGRLLRYLPLTPIEDKPEDWNDVGYGVFQHRRCSIVFRQKDRFDGQAYCLHRKVFSDNGGKTWFTSGNSLEPIEFPYFVPVDPKRYLVDQDGNILSEYHSA